MGVAGMVMMTMVEVGEVELDHFSQFSVACSKVQNIKYQRGIKGLIHLWIFSLTQIPPNQMN